MIRPLGIGLLLLCGSSLADTSGQRSVILMMGKPAGELVRSVAADGSIRVHYQYDDRGRGPNTDSAYRHAADGTLVEARTQGVNYLKGKVDESYSRQGNQARWKNSAEEESRVVDGADFYLSLDGPPEEYAMLARALLAAPGRALPTLPVGAASIEQLQTLELRAGAGAGAAAVQAGLYAISGLDLTPVYLWLDQDQQLFALYSPWQSTVREGYEAVLPELGRAQDAVKKAGSGQRARALTQWLSGPLLIENVRVFDPGTQQSTSGQSVLVDKGRIVAVGVAGGIATPAGVRRLDGAGRLLMPGLWDMHAHLAPGSDPLIDIAAVAARLPATLQRYIASGSGGLEVPKGASTCHRRAYQNLVDLTGMLHRSGVKLVAGTDGTAGFSLVRELELYVAAGIAPVEALRIATLGAAEVMKRDREYGARRSWLCRRPDPRRRRSDAVGRRSAQGRHGDPWRSHVRQRCAVQVRGHRTPAIDPERHHRGVASQASASRTRIVAPIGISASACPRAMPSGDRAVSTDFTRLTDRNRRHSA